MNNFKIKTPVFILVIVLLLVVVGVIASYILLTTSDEQGDQSTLEIFREKSANRATSTNNVGPQIKEWWFAEGSFVQKLEEHVIAESGQPIEGFEPFMFMAVFPGLIPTDFDEVYSNQGMYRIVNGEIVYERRNVGLPIHSAEKAISRQGYVTLLNTVSNRLNVVPEDEESINEIIKILSIK